MGKHRNLLTLMLIAALALVLVGIAFELLADGTGGWVAAYIAILALGSGITVALWLRRVHRSLASVRRIATDTANAMIRTEQRVTEANQTLGALGVRLIAVHELQGEVLRELRSGPVSSDPDGWPEGDPPTDPDPRSDDEPDAHGRYGRAVTRTMSQRSWTLDEPPPLSSSRKAKPASEPSGPESDTAPDDHSDDTTVFQRPAPGAQFISDAIADSLEASSRHLKARAERRLRKARREHAGQDSEPPPSSAS